MTCCFSSSIFGNERCIQSWPYTLDFGRTDSPYNVYGGASQLSPDSRCWVNRDRAELNCFEGGDELLPEELGSSFLPSPCLGTRAEGACIWEHRER